MTNGEIAKEIMKSYFLADEIGSGVARGIQSRVVEALNAKDVRIKELEAEVQTARKLNLVWGKHLRENKEYEEWHAPCGCSYHPEPNPHIHACSDEHNKSDTKP